MQCLKTLVLLGFFVCAASCSQVMVAYDYDSSVNFSGFKTYSWHAIERTIEMNDLIINRVKDSVNRELQAKGFRQVPEHPDFFIALHLSTRQKRDITDWGYGTGAYWGRGYVYDYGGISVIDYEEGTLIIDMVDAAENELVWRGSATDIVEPALSPEKRTQKIDNAVVRILEKFPPMPARE